ncbi:putative F-box/LRR-repeat protein 23 [Triticum dicoccoides]|uniref:putative F-box/LRR-repeat protein 23 n=1 Tax=Triticum dicoccoides TaxID=85692 RepID=UPI00188FC417|nr:putative F-box/LRR-repeat protein 23 [Triticum dicoccoides]
MAAPPSLSCLLEEPRRLPPPPQDGMDTESEWRDWAELPRDVLLAVLSRLDHIEILMGPDLVCSPWRRAATDEPELWRRIEMRFHYADGFYLNSRKLLQMVRAAMRRSAGRCEAFWGGSYVTERILSLVGNAAPSLKSLRLIECHDIVDLALKLVITKFPMLEELELSNCMHRFPETLEVVGDACPLLKRFRLSQRSFYSECVDDSAAMAIAKMPELRSLQLTANSLTNSGLELILNGCPLLESLDIRSCYHVCMDDEMQAKCARIKTLRHPEDSMDDYDMSFNYKIPRPCWSTEPIEYSMGCQSPY